MAVHVAASTCSLQMSVSNLMFLMLMRMLEAEEMERNGEYDSESEEQDDASSVSSGARADSPISNDNNTIRSLSADTETEAEDDDFEFDSVSVDLVFHGEEESSSSSSMSTISSRMSTVIRLRGEESDSYEDILYEDNSWDEETEYEPVSPAADLETDDAPEVGAHVTVLAATADRIAVRSPSISPRRSRARKRRATSEDVEAASCAICLDAWSGAGEHAAVALPCGHVFGHGCVRRWLRAKHRCPTCKVACSPGSVVRLRPALVSAPAAADLRLRLDETRAQVSAVAARLAHCTRTRDRMQGEVAELKKQLNIEEMDNHC